MELLLFNKRFWIWISNGRWNYKFKLHKFTKLDILLRGGDTDTNAAILGGMLGAAYGYEDLP